MLAHHPLTGKEVRILQTDASISKESKTLFYGAGSTHLETISEDLESSPTYALILKPCSLSVLKGLCSRIILISKEAYESVKDDVRELDNLIYLHEIHKIYPHLGGPWNGTAEDAAVLLAGLLRYSKIIGEEFSLYATERHMALGITVNPSEKPMRLWWITQYYTTEKPRRLRELKRCLTVNAASPLIDRIILLNERAEDLPSSAKIEEIVIGKRLTYDEVFKRIADFPDDVIVAFANADICIDDKTWPVLWSLNLKDKFLALLRYDVPSSDNIADATLFGPRPDSQDTWVIRAADVKSRGEAIWKNLTFKFGHMGCDNAIALEMLKQKFLVVNPALTMKTWHFHSSEVRNYNNKDILERPVFHYVEATGIHDLTPVLKWSSSGPECKVKKVQPAELRRVLRGSAVSAVHKKMFQANTDNLYVPDEEVIFELGECFQTADGLVFDKKNMYIGTSKKATEVWTKADMHGLMPTLEVERAIIVPWTPAAETSREVYCLRYLSKVLRLWDTPGDFFVNQGAEPILSLFNWGVDSLPVLAREPDALIWAKSAIGFPLTDTKFVLKEDVDALRKYLKGWGGAGNNLVIVENGLNLQFVADLEEALIAGWTVNVINTQKTSLFRMAELLTEARGIVCAGALSAYGWNWMLPVRSLVLECNSISTDALELSSSSGLVHHIVSCNVKEIVGVIGSAVEPASDVPIVWMPRSSLDGFFAHPGDSFREMVRLWAAAGLVTIKEHDGTMVWWDKVGADGVLLYDRPTNEWRLAASEAEKNWRLALFGNPKVGSVSKAVPWFFWPRRPELVEALASSGAAVPDRKGIVFYGKVENAVQGRRRKGDWKSVCSEWVLVQGDQPYPFTQKEYLERLGGALYGLCLAGYGYKCHREIECMVMGCVPVVAADVDMDSYANPPVVGVHYLRVNGPEDVAAAIAAVDDWQKMSNACRLWWKENASCAGSFELTKRLISQ